MTRSENSVNPDASDRPPSVWRRFIARLEVMGRHGHRHGHRHPGEAAPPRHQGSLVKERESLGIPLSEVHVGDRVCILALNCGEANNRFMGMGLVPGAIVEIVSATSTGSVIVALQDQRLGLGAEIAQQIQGSVVHPDLPPRSTAPMRSIPMQTFSESESESESESDWAKSAPPVVKLRDAAIGSVLKVIGYEPSARDYKRKLLAMGLTPGTELWVKRHAPLGDPTEIEVRGFRLTLRKGEADALIVERVEQ